MRVRGVVTSIDCNWNASTRSCWILVCLKDKDVGEALCDEVERQPMPYENFGQDITDNVIFINAESVGQYDTWLLWLIRYLSKHLGRD